jgi:biopolymer transport protein ExbD
MSTRHKSNDSGLEPTLPITPMLDMAFQLLAFFIFTYHPSDFEGQMDLSLPSEAASRAEKPENVDPAAAANKDQALEPESDVTVVVHAEDRAPNVGMIKSLNVIAGNISTDVDNLDRLRDFLKKKHAEVANKDSVKLQGDSRLKWNGVVQVMDVCRDAGFNNISFVPPPDFRLSSQP